MARSEKTESPLESAQEPEVQPKVNLLADSGVFYGWWVLLALVSGVVAFAVAAGAQARSTPKGRGVSAPRLCGILWVLLAGVLVLAACSSSPSVAVSTPPAPTSVPAPATFTPTPEPTPAATPFPTQAPSPAPAVPTATAPPPSATPFVVIEATATLGGCSFRLEVADTNTERSRGLREREFLPSNQGMLFVFGIQQELNFWMKNTLIPLDIVFMNDELQVVDVQTMVPEHEIAPDPLPFYTSAAPAKVAREVNAGVAAQCAITPGVAMSLTYLN